jgi:hypothetical protein
MAAIVQVISFTAEQSDTIKDAAISFAQSEIIATEAVKEVATIVGSNPTYTFWGLAAAQFSGNYMAARKCSEEAADKAWVRMARRMKESFGIEKPKAPSIASGKKAESREKTEKALKGLVAKHKTEAMLQRLAGEAMEAGKADVGYQLIEAAKLAKKLQETVAKDAQRARWENVAKMIAAAKKLHDEKTLSAIEKILSTTVPVIGTSK